MAIRIPIITAFNNGDLKKAQREIEQFANKATAQLKMLGVGAAVATGFAIKTFADFDDKMTQSLAIMGDVSEDLRKEMENTAREVAKSTTFSADQAAESYFFLASAGLDAAASIKALPQVSQFAQAGMFDMARATDLLTDAQSALGLTVRDDAVANLNNMARISDVLVKANTLANASVEQFSTALTTKAGPAMRAVGMDVEEGVAVLAAFADQGVKAELAGTNFSIVLRDLQTKALDNKEEFARLNVSVFDASGEMRNMADIVGDLENATKGMSDEQRKATFALLGFSDKSMGALAALMGTSEAIRTYEAGLRDANGITQEIADKQLVSFTSQLKLLWSQIQDVAIEVGAQLVPALTDMVKYLNTDEGRAKMEQLATSLAKVATQAATVVIFLGQNADKLDDILIAIGAVKIGWGILIATVAIYNAATLGAVAVTNALKGAIASTGVGLLIIGLGALVSGFISADENAGVAAEGADDYRAELQRLESQALNTTGALNGMTAGGFIPASPTADSRTRPLNPKPGEVYTFYNYDRVTGQAVWWRQTWTGTEWTKAEKMTYTPPSTGGVGTGKSAAEILRENRQKLIEEIASYNSELTRVTRIGAATLSSHEKAVVTTFEKVRETLNTAISEEVVNATAGRALSRLTDITEAALRKIAVLRADLAAQYEELVEKLNSAKALRESTRDQITALADLNKLSQSTVETVDATGKAIEQTAYSSATLIANLRGVIEGVRSFRDNMEILRNLGLDPRLYQQIIESGMIAGGATAKAIVEGGAESVAEINSLFAELETLGEDVGLSLSEVMYNGGERAIQGLIAGVLAVDNELATAAENIGSTFLQAFEGKISGEQINVSSFINQISAMSVEINELGDILGSGFRDAFLAAIGELDLEGLLGTKKVLESLGTVTPTETDFTVTVPGGGTVGGVISTMPEPIPAPEPVVFERFPLMTGGLRTNQPQVIMNYNITTNASDRISGAKAGESAVTAIKQYVDNNGSVISLFGG